ncbi:YeeE/YedE family protein [Polynucleobacter sp. HIN9]|uniref:YeeE/YedE family protein n=1 Tax=Polynucleobacter sp. HIN9 TaxID=3047868 RepID=UPI0025741146|nr:YeeE/YedE family protein [Polynucleobacter sp. HIN9]BEI41009.1 YeeE/YedE family protein [Polynucleobacter sp. HIN9]
MTIDWTSFTPGPALVGGILLGIAAALYVLINGRILGISGILGGLIGPKKSDWLWRASFILGLLTAPLWGKYVFQMSTTAVIDADYITLIVAGLLVGFGARYGSGCTSGHGICGLSRLSPRSLLATLTFMGCGFLVVYLVRHWI